MKKIIGDHLFIGKTEILRNAYNRLRIDIERYSKAYCAEQAAAFAMLDSFYGFSHSLFSDDAPNYRRDEFENVFDVIDINELAPFKANWVHGNTFYEDRFPRPEGVITSMEEL